MNQFFLYSFKAGVFLSVFYLVYFLFLSRDTAYLRNRAYLVASLILSWFLPLIKIQPLFSVKPDTVPSIIVEVLTYGEQLQQPEITAVQTIGPGFIDIISIVYLIGLAIFLLKLVVAVANIIRLIGNSSVEGRVVQFDMRDGTSGFSALGYIFVNRHLPDNDKNKIILHETIHNRSYHFIDILLIEIIALLQWMNPFIYLIKYSLRAVHEYQTDREYLSQTGTITEYQNLIFKQVFGTDSIPVASCFSASSLIKKRMIMMTKNETRPGAAIKLLIAVPLITGMIFLFSCGVMKETPSTSHEANLVEAAGQTEEITIFVVGDTSSTTLRVPREKSEHVKDSVRQAHAKSIKSASEPDILENREALLLIDGIERPFSDMKAIAPHEISDIHILKGEEAISKYGERGRNGVILITSKSDKVSEIGSRDDVYNIVEDMPLFQGGNVQKFSDWVKTMAKYPEIAHKNGIQGKVFVGFIIEPDGSVSNVTLLKGVDKSLDDEALRVVRSSPPWKPGKQRGSEVPVRFSITVNFALQAADQPMKINPDDVFMIVEQMPTFQGGDVQKFSEWVAKNVQYPAIAKENGIMGKVYLGFVVEKDGTVSNVKILRSIDKSLDDEAIRVVKSSPPWVPGYQRGEPMRVRFSITVNFDLGRTPVVKADSLLKINTVKK